MDKDNRLNKKRMKLCLKRSIDVHHESVHDVIVLKKTTFSSGRWIVSCSGDRTMRMNQVFKEEESITRTLSYFLCLLQLDDEYIVAGDPEGRLCFYRIREVRKPCVFSTEIGTAICLSRLDTNRFLVGTGNGSISRVTWDIKDRGIKNRDTPIIKELKLFPKSKTNRINCIHKLSTKPHQIVSSSWDIPDRVSSLRQVSEVIVWNVEEGEIVNIIGFFGSRVLCVSSFEVSSKKEELVIIGTETTYEILSMEGENLWKFRVDSGVSSICSFPQDTINTSKRFLLGCRNGSILETRLNQNNGKPEPSSSSSSRSLVLVKSGHNDWVEGFRFITDSFILTFSQDKTIKIWEMMTSSGGKDDDDDEEEPDNDDKIKKYISMMMMSGIDDNENKEKKKKELEDELRDVELEIENFVDTHTYLSLEELNRIDFKLNKLLIIKDNELVKAEKELQEKLEERKMISKGET